MATEDRCCTIVPHFKVHDGKLADFKAMCGQFIELTAMEPKCLYYGFSFDGDQAHCREGYEDATGLLAHLDNVGALLQEALKIADLTRLEVHGPEAELAQLREPLAPLEPQFFTALMAGLGLQGEAWDQTDRAAWPRMAARIAGVFATETRDDWAARFEATDACVTPVLTMTEAPGHPHNRARAAFTGPPDQPAPGPRLSNHPGSVRDCPTGADMDRARVLADWGV